MPTNYLTNFASGVSANLPSEATWQNLTELSTGFQTGLAKSSYFNRLFAQGAAAGYVIGQLVVDYASQDADLNGANLYTNFKAALNSYVGGSFLPLSGGTMTGAVTVNIGNGLILQGVAGHAGVVTLAGGNGAAATSGAKFYLYGVNNGTAPGQFIAQAGDANGYKQLAGKPDGSLTWGGKQLVFGVGTYTLTSLFAFGYITSSATQLTIILPIQVVGTITSANLTALTATVRVGPGAYTSPGGGTPESLIPAGVTKSIAINEGQVYIALSRSAGWGTGATNNAPVVANISSITFTVT